MASVLLRIIGVRQAPKRHWLTRIVTLVVLFPSTVLAQPQEGATSLLRQEQRVTAVDVLVELEAGEAMPNGKTRALPKGLSSEDFEVRLDGKQVPVVSFADPRVGSGTVPGNLDRAAQAEPWTIVLYFDLDLAERDTVRWAAAELAERARDLVALGEVELVVAEHGETRSLAPTRDGDLLEGELAGMMLDPHGVHRVLELRAEALEAISAGDENADEGFAVEEGQRAEIGSALVEQEVSAIEAHLDQLMVHLADRKVLGARRALFWISDGFDFDPAVFYRLHGLEAAPGRVSLAKRSVELAETLASYGWVTFSLSPPAAGPGLVPGFRIGKWLFRARMPPMKGIGGTLVHEERRDPDQARSHYSIGESHLASADPKAAQQSFETALYRFAGDPRTQKEQALAKAGLGRALEAQGDVAEARQAFRHAVELDPDLASLYPQVKPRLLAPRALQETLAASTAGRVVLDSEGVSEAISSLSRRARLTFQVEGAPRGVAHGLEVLVDDFEAELRHSRWARSGTPPAVAAARVRQLAGGEWIDGEIDFRVGFGSESEGSDAGGAANGLWIELHDDASLAREGREEPNHLRVTVAASHRDGAVRVLQHQLELPSEAIGGVVRLWVPIEKSDDEEWVAALVEGLESGRWGAAPLD